MYVGTKTWELIMANTSAIHRLSDNTTQKIRASVVVSSIVNVVEELVYNSLDARSSCIDVYLNLNPSSSQFASIQVTDDGVH